jgi:hypothetical protein
MQGKAKWCRRAVDDDAAPNRNEDKAVMPMQNPIKFTTNQ